MEKRPYLARPMTFLGIPVTPMGYYIDSVMTNAQIELMAADVSNIDFNERKKKKKGEFNSEPVDSAALERTNREWSERYGDDSKSNGGLSMKDILGGGINDDSVGVKIK